MSAAPELSSEGTHYEWSETDPQVEVPHMDLHTRKVLVVDDDMDTAEAIKFFLESYRQNISCEIASDAYEALNALSDHTFSMVLVDQKMPGLKGSNVLSRMDQFIDSDPVIGESGMYAHSVPTVLMSGAEVQLPDKFDLRHFNLLKVLDKKDLRSFLSDNFSH